MASISVLVNAQGRTIPVTINEGQTVSDVLAAANIAVNGREIRVDGNQVGVDFVPGNSAIVLLTDKIKGNEITNI
jgi:putative ubiquitin-RnfH superfamily antitoxin RatB of RatAB toxin-antitoxin module